MDGSACVIITQPAMSLAAVSGLRAVWGFRPRLRAAATRPRDASTRLYAHSGRPIPSPADFLGWGRRDNTSRASSQDAISVELEDKSGKETSEEIERIMSYKGLCGDDFRHPLDQQNTSFLQMVPGLESIAKSVMGPAAEQVLLLENIGTSVRVSDEQLPSVNSLLMEACQVLEMEPPELYIRQNPQPNAYTLAISGRKPFIVMHTSLLELLTPDELQVILAHELGHLKCNHGLWLTVANVLASGAVSILPVISASLEEGLLRWLRAAELTCDRSALLVAQNPKTVVSALMKLAGGSPSFAHELNVDAFLKQARSYDEATSSPLGWYLRNAQNRALSHPLPVMRAREIDRWSQSAQYKALVSKNRRFRPNSRRPSQQPLNMS